MSNARNLLSGFVMLALVGLGLVLIGYFFLGQAVGGTVTNGGDPDGFNVPKLEGGEGTPVGAAAGPEDKTLTLTVPGMARIEDDAVPDAAGGEETALKKSAAIHLKGTGFPWQKGANVYLAGHRLGYPRTESWLTFWDLDKLGNGDRVFVTDANGTKYTYEVFEESVVAPTDLSVTRPVPGKSIVTLQTCTLPDYSKRLVVQAELVEKRPAAARGGGPQG
ncbi:MAG: sortase [Rubrobacter sp.]